jgi:multidrug efflux pump subunit AcrB
VGVPLVALADITFGEGPIGISRYDRQPQASVEADLAGNVALSEATAAIKALPMMGNLPPGTTVREAGDAELQAELFSGFSAAMRNGLMVAYVVLALLFASLLQPLTILLSLPLSLAGVIIGLLFMNLAINLPVVIGILMLMGIVTKNAILLVDFAVESIGHGVNRTAAIIDAGEKRARPIIMTTIAMVAGMLPSALAFGDGGEFRSPMAIAVISGLVISTLLSLLFVPALFTLMDDLGLLLWSMFGRFVGGEKKKSSAHPSAAAAPGPGSEPASTH